ncbi:MAG: heme ABC exporter, ATP-binding protein CcmA [Alphaproteobacteria bacterium 41-28]|nr:MAG: heme ABC exporter, ATP-binding protein CcmA [Alphaproteobacteria bacterium 41-28]
MLEGKNISYARTFVPLFSDVSFALKEGEMLAVKGANGAGKSTLLRLLAGLIPPPRHTLVWKGEEIQSHNLSSYQQNLLYVGHKLALHPEALLKDQIHLWRDLYKVSANVIENALEIWGVAAFKDKKISHLSQGQQKRVSLSRCNWLQRPLWILDEPQVGLDEAGKAVLSSLLTLHLEKGGSIVLATHEEVIGTREIKL